MHRQMMKSKIHRAAVTGGNLNYIGSITIDEELMEKADIVENEKVLIVNLNNGIRYETYVIPGPRGSGMVCPNGGGARLTLPGDIVIIIAFGSYSEEEMKEYKPSILFMGENNRITAIENKEDSTTANHWD